MKNLLLLIAISFCFQLNAQAQDVTTQAQNSYQASNDEIAFVSKDIKSNMASRLEILQESSELEKIIQGKFGKRYKLSSNELVAFLIKTSYDRKINKQVRESAMKVLYGKLIEGDLRLLNQNIK